MKTLIGLLVMWMSAGCGAGAVSSVRGQASQDMTCSERDLTVTQATGAPNLYYAEGCKQIRRYFVSCNVFGLCLTPRGVNVLELVQRQAEFDLSCPSSSVAVQRMNTDTFGAKGCDRRVSYVVVCDGEDCRVVQNTQSQ